MSKNNAKEKRFNLDELFCENNRFKSYKREIDNYGFFIVKIKGEEAQTVKIYTPEMAYVLTTKELILLELSLNEKVNVNGLDYLDTYNEAYKKGAQYFDKEFKLSVNGIYGENAKLYVKNIHNNYFHVKHEKPYEGWVYVKGFIPTILTHEVIKKFGFYSGIVSRADDEFKKHYEVFNAFDVCEHNEKPHPIESQIEPFNPEIFKDQKSYDLFLFLVDEYATTKQPKQFSQIFYWMKENDNLIKPNKGERYKAFVKSRFLEMEAKYSRIDISHNETATLNDLRKKFNSMNKV
jgi:hypothetical protein